MQGIVISKNADLFTVENEGGEKKLKPSGKTKSTGIFVGDNVEFDENITLVHPRKNLLIRPPLANVDKMFIVISQKPMIEFSLLDRLLIYCKINAITPVIVINKIDICSSEFIDNIEKIYEKYYKIIKISAKNNILEDFEDEIEGITVLAGQSAVGKSSIIKTLFKNEISVEIGDLSKKIERGKQTTRLVKLFKFKNGFIADTAGFSLLNLAMVTSLEPRELCLYYPDFLEYIPKCKYRSCLHEGGDCGVLNAVKTGEISRQRYESYLKILNELKSRKTY